MLMYVFVDVRGVCVFFFSLLKSSCISQRNHWGKCTVYDKMDVSINSVVDSQINWKNQSVYQSNLSVNIIIICFIFPHNNNNNDKNNRQQQELIGWISLSPVVCYISSVVVFAPGVPSEVSQKETTTTITTTTSLLLW